MKTLLVLACSLLLAMSTSPGAAPPTDRGNKPDKVEKVDRDKGGKGDGNVIASQELVRAEISSREARRLAENAGAKGYKSLPPGIRKNLARGKPLPPGIQRTRMPDTFVSQLPHHPGHEWRAVGTDLLLMQQGTELVADVLQDVFR